MNGGDPEEEFLFPALEQFRKDLQARADCTHNAGTYTACRFCQFDMSTVVQCCACSNPSMPGQVACKDCSEYAFDRVGWPKSDDIVERLRKVGTCDNDHDLPTPIMLEAANYIETLRGIKQ